MRILLAKECYLTSVWPSTTTLTTNNIEQALDARTTLARKDLDPKIGSEM